MSENIGNNKKEIELERDPNYWQGFKDIQNDPEFTRAINKERDDENNSTGISRRKFLALVGASAALAGVGCSDYRDKGEIMSYNKMPKKFHWVNRHFMLQLVIYVQTLAEH